MSVVIVTSQDSRRRPRGVDARNHPRRQTIRVLPRGKKRATGFTLVEVMVVAAMTAFLAVLISGISVTFTRSGADAINQARAVASARMALESLRRDLAGSEPGNWLGTSFQGRVVGRLVTGDGRLMLCFDGGIVDETADWGDPDTVIEYELRGDQLIRTNRNSGADYVVAGGVSEFLLTDLADGVRIDLTVSQPGFTRTYTLVSKDP